MRNREPRLTVRALRPLISGLLTLGYDPVPFLQAQGIDSEMLLDPDATVPMSACVGLLADGVRATGDDNLGLRVAEQAELGSFDVHFYAMVSSPTLGAAFERVCRYQRLIHETSHVRLEKSGDRAVLSHRLAGGMAAPRQTAELLLAAWVRAGRVATRTKWTPAEVRFAHRAPRDARDHERFSVLHCGLRPARMPSYYRRRFSTCPVVAPILRCCRFSIDTLQTGSASRGRRHSPTVPARPCPRTCKRGT